MCIRDRSGVDSKTAYCNLLLPSTEWHGSRTPSRWCTKWIDLYELEYSEPCLEQPEERLNDTYRECNTWRYYPEYPDLWNHTNCPDPCLTYKCPKFAKCVTRNSKKEYKVM